MVVLIVCGYDIDVYQTNRDSGRLRPSEQVSRNRAVLDSAEIGWRVIKGQGGAAVYVRELFFDFLSLECS